MGLILRFVGIYLMVAKWKSCALNGNYSWKIVLCLQPTVWCPRSLDFAGIGRARLFDIWATGFDCALRRSRRQSNSACRHRAKSNSACSHVPSEWMRHWMGHTWIKSTGMLIAQKLFDATAGSRAIFSTKDQYFDSATSYLFNKLDDGHPNSINSKFLSK